jgi:uncharacterized protein (DUF1501 family)
MKTTLTRRTLLSSTAAAGAGLLLPVPALGATTKAVSPNWDRILIMIELNGANDGLNTVIPYLVEDYKNARPTLKYDVSVLGGSILGSAPYYTNNRLSETQLALNPSLSYHIKNSWDVGDMAIFLGLGYEQTSLSHFRSMDIWNGGTTANQSVSDNWLGRLLSQNNVAAQEFTAHGVLLSRYSSNPLQKNGIEYLAMSNPKDFISTSYYLKDTSKITSTNPNIEHVLRTQQIAFEASGKFRSALTVPNRTDPNEPKHYTYTPPQLGSDVKFNEISIFEKRCQSIAEMICTDGAPNQLRIPVYKVELGGFDNHDTQKAKHEDLLAQLGSGIANMRRAFINRGIWDRVLIMTYSEFGRRVEENGNLGTDHGTANCHFMLGGKVKGQKFYGTQPGLAKATDLDSRGNLRIMMDFRQYYATAASWLGLDTTNDAPYLANQTPVNLFNP